MEIFASGAWRTIARGEILIGGTWRRFTRAEAYIGGQWRTVASFVQPLSVSAYGVSGDFISPKPHSGLVITNATVATPVGGLAPYSYVWAITAGSASIASPTSASTNFSATLSANTETSATARVTCTDSQGSTAQAAISLSFSNHSDI